MANLTLFLLGALSWWCQVSCYASYEAIPRHGPTVRRRKDCCRIGASLCNPQVCCRVLQIIGYFLHTVLLCSASTPRHSSCWMKSTLRWITPMLLELQITSVRKQANRCSSLSSVLRTPFTSAETHWWGFIVTKMLIALVV